ncbi:hypothetical protein [Nostoc sp. CMAA1605]|uniref:hypothetical protein n=1 Tax=Nostoc sp. CMAA1605 TaxID=2055159 RepID=UPI001F1732B4|nr:hypothetical protein [Nostoc sp. CMAA1605]MCF4966768.1 hypothetical protein [Nostoc sp. CMAA1605]
MFAYLTKFAQFHKDVSFPSSNQLPQQLFPQREPMKHLLIGSPKAVNSTIHHLHMLGYANVCDWSPLLPTENPGEVMSILTRQILMQ